MIDYNKIEQSIQYYKMFGYKRIESPWLVSKSISDITRPNDLNYDNDYIIKRNDKHLVSSGEQSLLYLNLKKFIPLGKYQTVTPCFRNESFDFTHSKYFIKNELMITEGDIDSEQLDTIIKQARNFFLTFFPTELISIDKIDDFSYDINCILNINGNDKKFELGSYGIRSCDFLTWIYGTAIAEPRLSRLLSLYEKSL